jgi:hypothetical protein
MRRSKDFASLRLSGDAARFRRLALPEALTTARYETVFREKQGYATVDLVFEGDGEAALAHSVFLDTVALATMTAPILLWPDDCVLESDAAAAIAEHIFPWLRTLVRGRSSPGEEVRRYRASPLFEAARALGMRGAAPYATALPLTAPFVYARRFARDARVRIACDRAYEAAAVLGGRGANIVIERASADEAANEVARRWYGAPQHTIDAFEACDLAIVDDLADAYAKDAAAVVATRASRDAFSVVVPQPTPLDLLFTFDPADAPEVARFGVRASEGRIRPQSPMVTSHVVGGSAGRVAIVLRDDASYAPDADTDAAAELERRLRAEGMDPFRTHARDERIRTSDLIHVFGSVGDAHIVHAAQVARSARIPHVVSLAPVVTYTLYYEEAFPAALRLGLDAVDRAAYIDAFFAGKLQIDEIPFARDAATQQRLDRQTASACRDAVAVLLAPNEDVAAFLTRFPEILSDRIAAPPVLLGPEPDEERVVELLPPEPFVLLSSSMLWRSNIQTVLAALADEPFAIVVAGPVSDVECTSSLRRIAQRDVVFISDPSPGMLWAILRRATVVVEPSLRPAGVSRLLRALRCGVLPLVPQTSPLAALVEIATCIRTAMRSADRDACIARLTERNHACTDQQAALRAVVQAYARVAQASS